MSGKTEICVLAAAGELATDPQLLSDWRKVVGGSSARLLIYPDGADALPDPRLVNELIGSDTDSRAEIRATLLAGPVTEERQRTLLRGCAGFYGRGEMPPAMPGLVRLGIDDVAALLSPSRKDREVTLVGGGYRIQHRESGADRGVLVQVFQLQEYSFEPLSPWLHGLQTHSNPADGQAPLIVDCGANIGASVVYFARTFPNAHIVALEPEPDNFSLLAANAAPFGHRVTAWQKAVASQPGIVRLTDPGLGEWGYRTGATAEGRLLAEVAAVTIDDVLASAPETRPFVLKVDIEGAEAELFAARGKTLDRFPVVIVELHDWMWPGTRVSTSFLTWHAEHRREMRTAGENFFSLSATLAS